MNSCMGLACGVMIAVALLSGCGKDNAPLSATAPAPPPQPPAVDFALVGTWYEVGADGGLEFNSDATWQPLYVYGGTLHTEPLDYYDGAPGGNFRTTPDGKCIFSWPEVTIAGWVTACDTTAYVLGNVGTNLTLEYGDSTSHQRRFFVRKDIGSVVQSNSR